MSALFVFKNKTNMIYYVGSVRFAPKEIKTIDKVTYLDNKDYFDIAIKNNSLVSVSDEDVKEYGEKQKEIAKEQEEKENRSIMAKYKDGDLHWRQAERAVKEIESLDELESLLKEGFDLGYDLSNIVMKTIRDSIKVYKLKYNL